MNKPNYQTSLQFSAEDYKVKEKLKKAKVSIIDTWRKGAEVIEKELQKKS